MSNCCGNDQCGGCGSSGIYEPTYSERRDVAAAVVGIPDKAGYRPPFVWLEHPEHATKTALRLEGAGTRYHRAAGCWSVDSWFNANDVLMVRRSDDPRTDHMIGWRLVECEPEEYFEDNRGYDSP
jgi:hypothetical protein